MTDHLLGATVRPADLSSHSASSGSPSSDAAPALDFRAALHAGAESVCRGEAALDAAISRLGRGGTMAPEELIALQAAAYRHATEVELAAKLVDKLSGAVRTTLTSQQ